jgi:hypothetical protein
LRIDLEDFRKFLGDTVGVLKVPSMRPNFGGEFVDRPFVVTAIAPNQPFTVLTRPTAIQQKAFDLLGFPLACTQ